MTSARPSRRRAHVHQVPPRTPCPHKDSEVVQKLGWGDGVLAIAYIVWLEVGDAPREDDEVLMSQMAREEFIECAGLRTSWVLRATSRSPKDTAMALRRRRSRIVLVHTLDVIGAAGILFRMQARQADSLAWQEVFAAWEARGLVDAHIAALTGAIRDQLAGTSEQQRAWLVSFLARLPKEAGVHYGGR